MRYVFGEMGLLACAIVFLAAVAASQDAKIPGSGGGTRGDHACVLAGRITSMRTGTPVSRATIELSTVDSAMDAYADFQWGQLSISAGGLRAQYSAMSDKVGDFCFGTVKAGRYRLSGRKHGYLETSYGASTPTETGAIVDVHPQDHKELSFSLSPQGTISGKVTDADGEPVDSGSVRAMLRVWIRGAFRNVPVAGGRPNDLGEFRLANLAPGTYYVVFQPASANSPTANQKGEESNAPQVVRTFYPAATLFTLAVPIRVGVGSDVQDVDIHAQKIPTHRLRGKVLGDRREADFGAISISPEDEDATSLVAGGGGVRRDHTFEFAGLPPGSYKVTYLVVSGGTHNVSREVFQVGDKDVDDAVLSVTPPVSVRGRVRLEGADQPNLSDVQLQLISIDALVAPNFSANVQPDGAFVIEDVSAGKYLVHFRVPSGSYLKSARFGLADIADKLFDVPGGGGEMEIVLRSGAAEVNGTIEAPQGSAAPSVVSGYFLLVPDDLAPDGSGVRFGGADANGEFSVKDLRPGHYRAYAFASLDPSAVQDPNVLRAIEPFATGIDLEENGKATVALRVIPPDQAASAFSVSRIP